MKKKTVIELTQMVASAKLESLFAKYCYEKWIQNA